MKSNNYIENRRREKGFSQDHKFRVREEFWERSKKAKLGFDGRRKTGFNLVKKRNNLFHHKRNFKKKTIDGKFKKSKMENGKKRKRVRMKTQEKRKNKQFPNYFVHEELVNKIEKQFQKQFKVKN